MKIVSTKRRTRAEDHPYLVGAHGLPLCRWCRKMVEPPRSTFCSAACVHEYKLRSDPAYLRSQVFMRDKGVCHDCGVSTMDLRRQLDALSEAERNMRCEALGIPKSRGGPGNSLWDGDHVVPVSEGGGECGLENIATLCVPCHHKKNSTDKGSTDGRRRVVA